MIFKFVSFVIFASGLIRGKKYPNDDQRILIISEEF